MIKDYIIKERLGTGAFGVVYKVVKKITNKIYVIKQIPLLGLTSKQKDDVKLEAKILSSVRSIYIVRYYESFEENNYLNIVMEYCDGGDLCEFINKNKSTRVLLKEELVWNLFLKICIGLATLHKYKILHRDLKTLNIFLTKELDVKIGDFGVAKILTQSGFAKTIIGTPYYLSPELCEEQPYNDKSDVWALGCILYELCTYRHPFNAKCQASLVMKIIQNEPEPIHKYYSYDLQKLINLILDKNHLTRPSCHDILNYPFVMEKIKQFGLLDKVRLIYNGRSNLIRNNGSNYSNKTYMNRIENRNQNIVFDKNTVPIKRINQNCNNLNYNNYVNSNRNLDYKRAKEINNSYIDDYQRNKRKSHIIYSSNNNPSKINYKQCLKSELIYNNNINKLDNRAKRNSNYNNHVLFISKSNDNFKKNNDRKENRSKSCERNKNHNKERIKSNNISYIVNENSNRNNISNISKEKMINDSRSEIISLRNNNIVNMKKRNYISNISYINVSNNNNKIINTNNNNNNINKNSNNNRNNNNKSNNNNNNNVIKSIDLFEKKMENENKNNKINQKQIIKKADNNILNFENDELLMKNIKITDILENDDIDKMIQNELSKRENNKKGLNMKDFANYLNSYVSEAKINNIKSNTNINKKTNIKLLKNNTNKNNEKKQTLSINYSVDSKLNPNPNLNKNQEKIVKNLYNNNFNKNVKNEVVVNKDGMNKCKQNFNNNHKYSVSNIKKSKENPFKQNYSNRVFAFNQKKSVSINNVNIINRINSEVYNKNNQKKRINSLLGHNDKQYSDKNCNSNRPRKIKKISIIDENDYEQDGIRNRKGQIKTDIFN